MSFKSKCILIVKWILFPFSILYGFGIHIRHWLYKIGLFKSANFSIPLICVGNLSIGGTGKSPMVIYLTNLLIKHSINTAILSRGYKRTTKGLLYANSNSTASSIGDEPLMFYTQLNNVDVVVSEKRTEGIYSLLMKQKEAIILDDAMQHRQVNPSFTIMLTEYNNLYYNDYMLPTGTLRDIKARAVTASVIVVTKCHSNFSAQQKTEITNQLKTTIPIFFTSIQYESLYNFFDKQPIQLNNGTDVLLITGIANPASLQQYLMSKCNTVQLMQYPDHYSFTSNHVQQWIKQINSITTANKIIVTTQKDAMRMLPFKKALQHLPIFVLPINIQFLFNEQEKFDNLILQHLQSFKTLN